MVTRAVVVWSGFGDARSPDRDEKRLVATFGPELALELALRVRELEDDFYESLARHTARDLAKMSDVASADFVSRHPEIGGDAVAALAWCYTFDFK
jgi:hypothetical protein